MKTNNNNAPRIRCQERGCSMTEYLLIVAFVAISGAAFIPTFFHNANEKMILALGGESISTNVGGGVPLPPGVAPEAPTGPMGPNPPAPIPEPTIAP